MRRNVGRQRRKLARPVALLHIISTSRLLTALRNDKRLIFTAAAHAQRAVDYLHGLQPKAETGAETDQTEERAAISRRSSFSNIRPVRTRTFDRCSATNLTT